MSKINFNHFGESMSFKMKLLKHMESNNPERVKDYLTHGFDTVNPAAVGSHPCIDVIMEAGKFMAERGWTCSVMNWKDKGPQFVCISPNGEYYRSHYNH